MGNGKLETAYNHKKFECFIQWFGKFYNKLKINA